MKKNFHLPVKAVWLCIGFLSGMLALNAQVAPSTYNAPGTYDDDFILRITSPSNIKQDLKRDPMNCGWLGAFFGPSLTNDLCGDVVWAFPDSLACGPLPAGSMTGKIAFIRRGICNYSLKVYYAQQAGAKAAIIANHYLNNALGDGPCIA